MPKRHDKNKTKEQLIKELAELRQRIGELERTENECKKEVLRGSEGELRDIIDSVKDGIVLLDLTGKVTAINKSVTEVAGYAEEDIVGKRFKVLKMFPPKSIATMLVAFKQVISGQQPPPYEVEVYTRTGKKLAVEIHGSLLKKGEGKAGVVAVLRDITVRKQLEALLLRERETFVTIVQNSLYGVVLLDKEGKHIYVNSAFTLITGYTLEDIPTGKDWMYKAYPDKAYRQQVVALWKKDRRVRGTRRVFSVVCKNGETKEIEFSPTVLDDGRAVVMLSDITERKRVEEALQRHREHLEELVTERTAALQATNAQLQQEITERKQMQDELRENEGKYRSLVESSKDSIYLIDSTCHYLFVNSKYLSRLGEQSSHVIGKGYSEFHSPEASKDFSQRVKTVVKTGTAQSYEYWSQRDNRYFIRTLSPVTSPDGGKINAITVISKDINERKQAEERLKESEERFRAIFEASQDLIFIKDRDLKFTAVNPAMERYFGVSASEMVGKTTASLFGRGVSKRSMEEEDLRVLGGEVIDTEHSFQVQGNTVIQNVVKVPIRNITGEIIGICGTARDITERKQMEEELRESEERFKMLAEDAPFGISIMAPDRSFEYLNPRFTEIFGYTMEDLPDKDTWFKKAYPDKAYRDKVILIWKRDTAEEVRIGDGNLRVFTVRCKDGQDKIIDFRSVDLKDGKQYLVYEDITARAKAEEALRESEEKYRELINGMNDTAWVIDFDGNFIDVNDAAVEVLGYSREELLTMGPHDIDSGLDAENITGLIKRMRTDKLQVFETTHTTKDGKTIPVEIKSSLVTYQGNKAILSIARDITERKQAEEALRESESRFRLLVEHSQDTILLQDFDGKIIDVNQHGCDSLGYTRKELLGLSVQDIDQRVVVDKHQVKWKQMVPGVPITLEGVHRRKDGTTFPVEVRLGVLESGGRRLILGLGRDITERKQMEESLREKQQELQALMDASPAAISWADLQGNIRYINRKHHELFGYTLKDIPTIDEWQRQADQDQVQQKRFAHWPEELMEAQRQGRSLPSREMTITCKDGSIRYVTVEGAIVSNHNLVIYNDITERVRAEEVIRKLAYHDALTGLPNRVLFADRLDFAMSQAHRSQHRLAVMSLDLDRFKNVNDTFGHNVGDKLLHSVGKRLTRLLRKNDTISRTGGDEFSLLMPEIDQEKDTVTVAQKVLNVFQEPFVLDVHELHITTSIGIAIYPDDGEDADTLLKHSDIAMYQAKQKGRNNYQRYSPI